MSFEPLRTWRRIWCADFLSSKDLLRRGITITALFLVAHVAGLREYVSILSGTLPSPEVGWTRASFFGLVYITLYFGFVLVVPVLLLAAGMLKGWELVKGIRTSGAEPINAAAKSVDDQSASSGDIRAAAGR